MQNIAARVALNVGLIRHYTRAANLTDLILHER
jgi:hypothetical protein